MKRIRLALLALCISSSSPADNVTAELLAFAHTQATNIASRADVIEQVKRQNKVHATLSQAQIAVLDKDWRQQFGNAKAPLINSLMDTPLSDALRHLQLHSNELITEIIIMDNRGLNVAQSTVTSDYWQGDEAKWLQTFMVGPDAEHVGELGRDDSTGSIQIQVSRTISDSHGQPIGAVTVGVAPVQF